MFIHVKYLRSCRPNGEYSATFAFYSRIVNVDYKWNKQTIPFVFNNAQSLRRNWMNCCCIINLKNYLIDFWIRNNSSIKLQISVHTTRVQNMYHESSTVNANNNDNNDDNDNGDNYFNNDSNMMVIMMIITMSNDSNNDNNRFTFHCKSNIIGSWLPPYFTNIQTLINTKDSPFISVPILVK